MLRSILPISMPSISIYPANASTILGIARLIVDLPAPVLPTSPTFLPASILNERPFSTSGRCFRYLSRTSLNSTSPFIGQTEGSTFISADYFSCGQIFCIVIAHFAYSRLSINHPKSHTDWDIQAIVMLSKNIVDRIIGLTDPFFKMIVKHTTPKNVDCMISFCMSM